MEQLTCETTLEAIINNTQTVEELIEHIKKVEEILIQNKILKQKNKIEKKSANEMVENDRRKIIILCVP